MIEAGLKPGLVAMSQKELAGLVDDMDKWAFVEVMEELIKGESLEELMVADEEVLGSINAVWEKTQEPGVGNLRGQMRDSKVVGWERLWRLARGKEATAEERVLDELIKVVNPEADIKKSWGYLAKSLPWRVAVTAGGEGIGGLIFSEGLVEKIKEAAVSGDWGSNLGWEPVIPAALMLLATYVKQKQDVFMIKNWMPSSTLEAIVGNKLLGYDLEQTVKFLRWTVSLGYGLALASVAFKDQEVASDGFKLMLWTLGWGILVNGLSMGIQRLSGETGEEDDGEGLEIEDSGVGEKT